MGGMSGLGISNVAPTATPGIDQAFSETVDGYVRFVRTENVAQPPEQSLDIGLPGLDIGGAAGVVGQSWGDSMYAQVQQVPQHHAQAMAALQDSTCSTANLPQVTGAPNPNAQELIAKFNSVKVSENTAEKFQPAASVPPSAQMLASSGDTNQAPAYHHRSTSSPSPATGSSAVNGGQPSKPMYPPPGQSGNTGNATNGHGNVMPSRQASADQHVGLTVEVVLSALKTPSGEAQVYKWWDEGHGAIIASALSKGDGRVGGPPWLIMIKDLLTRSSSGSDKNPSIAKDLCVAMGNVARSGSIDNVRAQQSLPVTLATMQSFSFDVNVYSAACYALANILKVSNEISDDRRRREVADWVSHAMSFNLNGTGQPRMPSLAYLTASAARNFVWMRESNAKAFFLRREGVKWSAAENMRASMLFFRSDPTVVESCLSAFAALSYFPAYRIDLIRIRTVSAVGQVLDIATGSNLPLLSMGLTAIGILVAGRTPPQTTPPTEVQTISTSLINEGGVAAVIKVLEKAVRNGSMPVIETGLHTLAALARFDLRLADCCVQLGGVGPVVQAVWCAVRGAPQSVTARTAEVMCGAVNVLSGHAAAASAMRLAGIAEPMTTLVTRFASVPVVVTMGNQAISRVR
jgi:hypothetical protein